MTPRPPLEELEALRAKALVHYVRQSQETLTFADAMLRELPALAALIRQQQAVIEQLEWNGLCSCCPICDNMADEGHKSDCKLAACLATRSAAEQAADTYAAWLIERGQPERQHPTVWWNQVCQRWFDDAHKASKYPTKELADEALVKNSGIEGVHSPFGRVVQHVFIGQAAEQECQQCEGRGEIDDPEKCGRCGVRGCKTIPCPACKAAEQARGGEASNG